MTPEEQFYLEGLEREYYEMFGYLEEQEKKKQNKENFNKDDLDLFQDKKHLQGKRKLNSNN